jgi:hypothetical protein
MRCHQIVGIPPSELGGISTPSQDREGENTRSGSSASEEHPARHPDHGAILPSLTSIVQQAAAPKVSGSLARRADLCILLLSGNSAFGKTQLPRMAWRRLIDPKTMRFAAVQLVRNWHIASIRGNAALGSLSERSGH